MQIKQLEWYPGNAGKLTAKGVRGVRYRVEFDYKMLTWKHTKIVGGTRFTGYHLWPTKAQEACQQDHNARVTRTYLGD